MLDCRSRALKLEVLTELHLTLVFDWQQREKRGPELDRLVVDPLFRQLILESYPPRFSHPSPSL